MKVRPIKRRKTKLLNVRIDEKFTLNGVEYVKLDNCDPKYGGVLATTCDPLDVINSVCQHNNESLEERAVKTYMENLQKNKCNIAFSHIPDTDDLQKYNSILCKHIKEYWYVDAGESCVTLMNPGDYFYVDEFCEINKGNEYDEKQDGVSRRVSVRAFYGINPYADVIVDM